MRPAENPFRMSRLDALSFREDGFCHDRLLTRLENMRFRGAIVGPHGSGKSTLLGELGPQLEARGFKLCSLFINADRDSGSFRDVLRRVRTVDARTMVLFDGGCHLNAAEWLWFRLQTGHAAGVLITAHEEGRLPTVFRTRTSVDLLIELYDELAESGHRRPDLRALFDSAGGNLRLALRDCYWLAARG